MFFFPFFLVICESVLVLDCWLFKNSMVLCFFLLFSFTMCLCVYKSLSSCDWVTNESDYKSLSPNHFGFCHESFVSLWLVSFELGTLYFGNCFCIFWSLLSCLLLEKWRLENASWMLDWSNEAWSMENGAKEHRRMKQWSLEQ